MMANKWKSGKYIAYFQAYTNTYAPIDILKEKYNEALKQKDVVGLAIATRPDCLSEEVLDLLEEINKKVYVWIELGFQTVSDETARLINRGYTLDVFEKALEDLRKRNIDVVVHTIFGLPKENKEDMLNTIRYLADKDIQGIKFHLLHLMKDTPMVKLYEKGMIEFLSKEDYIDLICQSICMLPQNVVVHRLTGDSPRELLIGPMWSLKKWEILNEIDKTMEDNDYYQGKFKK
ncbi:coproporphyrinogen III oxidase [compost metagenome]